MTYVITFKFGPDEQGTEIRIPDDYGQAEAKVAKLCQSLRFVGAIDLEVRLVNERV